MIAVEAVEEAVEVGPVEGALEDEVARSWEVEVVVGFARLDC